MSAIRNLIIFTRGGDLDSLALKAAAELAEIKELDELIKRFKWHWTLEKVSEGDPPETWDSWCVYDTDTWETLSYENTPEKAICRALDNPLGKNAQKYTPKYAWAVERLIIKLRTERDEARNIMSGFIEACENNQELLDLVCCCSPADDSVGVSEVLCEYHLAKLWLSAHPEEEK